MFAITAFFFTMTFGACGAINATYTFGRDRAVYYREVASGIHPLPFFLAKCTHDLWNILLQTMIFMTFYYLLAPPAASFGFMFGVFFSMLFAAFGMGYLISVLVTMDKAKVMACIAAVAFSVTSGLSPTLKDVTSNFGPGRVFWDISYCRWAGEAMVDGLTANYHDENYRTDLVLHNYGYQLNQYWKNFWLCIAIGVGYRIVTYLVLRYTNKRNQK